MAHKIYTFGDMKARTQHLINENDYFVWLLTADEMMFSWKGLPEEIDQYRIEDFLNITTGFVYQEIDGKRYVAPYTPRCGELDMYGYGTEISAITLNGIALTGTVGKDIAVCYNNTARGCQWDLVTDADIFADIDRSTKINVLFARIAPILQYSNDGQKNALKDAIQHIINGELDTVFSDNLFDVFGDKDNGIQKIDITEPEKAQYIQYLSRLYDNRLQRHFARRGLTIKTTDKQAQASTDEVHGMDAVAWFYPLSKLKARKEGAEMINKIYGTNISVEFSDLWQQEYDAYKLRTLQKDADAEQETKGVENNVEMVETGNDTAGDSDTDVGS